MISLPLTRKKRSWIGFGPASLKKREETTDPDCPSLCLIGKMYTWLLKNQFKKEENTKKSSSSTTPFVSMKNILSYTFSQERENDFQFLKNNLAPWRRNKEHSAAIEAAKNTLCNVLPFVLVETVLNYFSAESQYLTHLFHDFFQGLTMKLFLKELSFFSLRNASAENCLCPKKGCAKTNASGRKCDKHDHQCITDTVVEEYLSIFHPISMPQQYKWFGEKIERFHDFSTPEFDFHPLKKTKANTKTAGRKRKQSNFEQFDEKESEKKMYPFTYYFNLNKGNKFQLTSSPTLKLLKLELENDIIQARTLDDILSLTKILSEKKKIHIKK